MLKPEDQVTLIIKTFERPKMLERLLASIEKYMPEYSVIVVDDSADTYAQNYKSDKVEVLCTEHDIGLSEGRNRALRLSNKPYFLLFDDDMYLDHALDITSLLDMMDRHDLDVLGYGLGKRKKIVRINYERQGDTLIQWSGSGKSSYLEPALWQCDKVNNCLIGKKDPILSNGGWDSDLKIIEHWEFFYRLKGKIKVAVTRSEYVMHGRNLPSNPVYMSFRRKRRAHFKRLGLSKHGLRKLLKRKS